MGARIYNPGAMSDANLTGVPSKPVPPARKKGRKVRKDGVPGAVRFYMVSLERRTIDSARVVVQAQDEAAAREASTSTKRTMTNGIRSRRRLKRSKGASPNET